MIRKSRLSPFQANLDLSCLYYIGFIIRLHCTSETENRGGLDSIFNLLCSLELKKTKTTRCFADWHGPVIHRWAQTAYLHKHTFKYTSQLLFTFVRACFYAYAHIMENPSSMPDKDMSHHWLLCVSHMHLLHSAAHSSRACWSCVCAGLLFLCTVESWSFRNSVFLALIPHVRVGTWEDGRGCSKANHNPYTGISLGRQTNAVWLFFHNLRFSQQPTPTVQSVHPTRRLLLWNISLLLSCYPVNCFFPSPPPQRPKGRKNQCPF